MAGIDLSGSIFRDRRTGNRRQYTLSHSVPDTEQRSGERRSRNGLFSVSDKAWWLKVNYLDADVPKAEKGERQTGS